MTDQTSRTPRTDAFEETLDRCYPSGFDQNTGTWHSWPDFARALELEAADLRERETMRLAGISTAALGYWKKGSSIHPDYVTTALYDVADLYAKYADLRERLAKAREEAIEECARVCDAKIERDSFGTANSAWSCAVSIRALAHPKGEDHGNG